MLMVYWVCVAGDDADDMMDDGHSSRLRERLKKESSGLLLGQSAASISRNKRKRQGSQEMQVQARNGPGDDLEEVTEDTEMGVSEDDDDNPPPLPRRHGKLRPQGKVSTRLHLCSTVFAWSEGLMADLL